MNGRQSCDAGQYVEYTGALAEEDTWRRGEHAGPETCNAYWCTNCSSVTVYEYVCLRRTRPDNNVVWRDSCQAMWPIPSLHTSTITLKIDYAV